MDKVTRVLGWLGAVALVLSYAAVAVVLAASPSQASPAVVPSLVACPPGAPPNSSLCSPSGWAVYIEAGLTTASAAAAAGVTLAVPGMIEGDGEPVEVGMSGTPGLDFAVPAVGSLLEQKPALPAGWESLPVHMSSSASIISAPLVGQAGVVQYSVSVTCGGTWANSAAFGACVTGTGWFQQDARMGYRQSDTAFYAGGPFNTPYSYSGDRVIATNQTYTGSFAVPSGWQQVFFQSASPNVVRSYYYTPGSPGAPTGNPGGLVGTWRQTWSCKSPTGTTTQTRDKSSLGGLSASLLAMTCPAGSVLSTWSVDWITATKTQRVYEWTAPEWVMDIPVEYPGCIDGSCRLQLWKKAGATAPAEWCGNTAVGCPQWWVDPAKESHYECRYGSYTVDLGACAIYRKPGQVSPNTNLVVDANGNVTGNPQPVISTNPSDFVDIDAIIESWVPGAGELPDPLPSSSSSECFPSGWGVFNPLEWVYRPIVCALTWAFVPRPAVVQAQLTEGSASLESHGVLAVIPAAASVPGTLSSSYTGGCSGGLMDVTVDAYGQDIHAGLPCSPAQVSPQLGSAYAPIRSVIAAFIVAGTAWSGYLMVSSYLGGKGEA